MNSGFHGIVRVLSSNGTSPPFVEHVKQEVWEESRVMTKIKVVNQAHVASNYPAQQDTAYIFLAKLKRLVSPYRSLKQPPSMCPSAKITREYREKLLTEKERFTRFPLTLKFVCALLVRVRCSSPIKIRTTESSHFERGPLVSP